MGYAGSLLRFYGAAWDGERVKVEPLVPGLELATHWKERSARNAIASCFDAFVLAIENIQAHYGSIEAAAQANQAHLKYNFQEARGYPFLTSYSDEGQEITFTYDKRLDEDKLLFSATINPPGSGECIVKFTSQYSKAAHDYLASHCLAPRIWKWIRISADWTAVVMDKSKYQVLFGLWLSKAERDKIQRKVQSIVRTLHEGGFVHGDIRDVNLLIDRASLESDVMVHLIDFDWAGPVGEAKYPMGINCKTVRRPAGVKGGELITEGHDNEMVSSLFTN
jgi:serine/threonine protein kinase